MNGSIIPVLLAVAVFNPLIGTARNHTTLTLPRGSGADPSASVSEPAPSTFAKPRRNARVEQRTHIITQQLIYNAHASNETPRRSSLIP